MKLGNLVLILLLLPSLGLAQGAGDFCFSDPVVMESMAMFRQMCEEMPGSPECPEGNIDAPLLGHELAVDFIGSLQTITDKVFDFERELIPTSDELRSYHDWMNCLAGQQGTATPVIDRYWLLALQTKLLVRYSNSFSRVLLNQLRKRAATQNITIGGLVAISSIALIGRRVKAIWSMALGRRVSELIPRQAFFRNFANYAPLAALPLHEQVDEWDRYYERNPIPIPPNYYLAYNLSTLNGSLQWESDAILDEVNRLQTNEDTFALSAGLVASILVVDSQMGAAGAGATTVVARAGIGAAIRRGFGIVGRGVLQAVRVAVITTPIMIPVWIAAEIMGRAVFRHLQKRALHRRLRNLALDAQNDDERAASIAEYAHRLDAFMIKTIDASGESASHRLSIRYLIEDSQISEQEIGNNELFLQAGLDSREIRHMTCFYSDGDNLHPDSRASERLQDEIDSAEPAASTPISGLADFHLDQNAGVNVAMADGAFRSYIDKIDIMLEFIYERMQGPEIEVPDLAELLYENEQALLLEREFFAQQLASLDQWRSLVLRIPEALRSMDQRDSSYIESTRYTLNCN